MTPAKSWERFAFYFACSRAAADCGIGPLAAAGAGLRPCKQPLPSCDRPGLELAGGFGCFPKRAAVGMRGCCCQSAGMAGEGKMTFFPFLSREED